MFPEIARHHAYWRCWSAESLVRVLPIISLLIDWLCFHLSWGCAHPFLWLHVLGVSGERISMTLSGRFEVVVMVDSVVVTVWDILFLLHQHFDLLILTILLFIFREIVVAVGHGLEHDIMDNFAFPHFFVLLGYFLRPLERVRHVVGMFKQFILNFESGISHAIGRLRLNLSTLISISFFLRKLFLFLMFVIRLQTASQKKYVYL